ncbi:MAG TPA: hypothetical protein VMA55_00670 [Acidovorax sp.]|nr:hypothetical protein [Acidovorax sp.]
MNAVHPAFAPFLAWFAPEDPEQEKARKLAAYHDLLSSFDWQYNFADDHDHRWKRGQKAYERLLCLQMEVDPDASIWMSYPGAQQWGAAQPQLRGGQR